MQAHIRAAGATLRSLRDPESTRPAPGTDDGGR
jgi:hypothetical protein